MRRLLFISFIITAILSCQACDARVRHYKVKAVREYSHDTGAYTQGLFFYEGAFYESTGQYGSSSFRKVDLQTGKVLEKVSFNRKYFGEGSVIFGDKLYILTWTNRVVFVYDAAGMKYEKTLSYPREGWGLTTDGKQLIASDGSSKLFFMDKDLKTVRTVDVRMEGRPVRYLNELEWIDGKVWANVYMTDMIVVIDPKDGNVESVIDCGGLLPAYLRTDSTDVLNGIAYLDGRIFLTGKYWPRLYEVSLEERK